MPYIQLEVQGCTIYRCAQKFHLICKKNFRTWNKFQDISVQLLKFQKFQDNTQAWMSLFAVAT